MYCSRDVFYGEVVNVGSAGSTTVAASCAVDSWSLDSRQLHCHGTVCQTWPYTNCTLLTAIRG